MRYDSRLNPQLKAILRFNRLLVLGIVSVAGIALMGQAAPSKKLELDMLKVRALLVVNDHGKPVMTVSADEDTGLLRLTDSSKQYDVSLFAGARAAGLVVQDYKEDQTVALGLAKKEAGLFITTTNKAKPRLRLAHNKLGTTLVFSDRNGKPKVILGLDKSDQVLSGTK